MKVRTTEQDGQRVVRSQTPAGELVARWTLGPDGDWWQMEYPVKGVADRVPVDAELGRLEAIPALVERASLD